ncbi:NCS1 family nucleobase:cation symporter-1 [Saccharopolyspora spinosa]|uniref:NCS1 family nucleobase:cation symporter-1 n=2 Tax=Saccharopolyspora spinosa TaxID=60894 RepID=A0A2N3Y0N1_SACSN|nr:NCS1 family nucleobase:cation symporter-1 [Saccharopolyspora spinosa]
MTATNSDLASADPSGRLYNPDLAPVPKKERTWGWYSIFAVWMSVAHNAASYTFAAGLFLLGLNGWQILISVLAGTLVLYVGCAMSGVIGQRTGLPFPVLSRVSWGLFGANIPALIRGIIAIFWYGIQTYLASVAISVLLVRINPGLESWTEHSFLGLHALGWMSFLALWLIQWLVIGFGMDMVRRFQEWAGPVVWVVMLVLAVWLVVQAKGHIDFSLSVKQLSGGQQAHLMLTSAALVVSQLATLALNFCDFGRFVRSSRAVRVGTMLGAPLNWTAFSVTSVVISVGSVTVFGQALLDPAELLGKVPNTGLLIVGVFLFAFATIGVNIVSNFVSPAYDLANVWPKKITFRRGGAISSVAAILVMPWKLFSSPIVINYFLGALGAFLGPLFAIMMLDYYVVQRRRVLVEGLFRVDGSAYAYKRGVNPKAIAAFVPSAALSAVLALVPVFENVAPFAWLIGGAVAAGLYHAMNRTATRRPVVELGVVEAGSESTGAGRLLSPSADSSSDGAINPTAP